MVAKSRLKSCLFLPVTPNLKKLQDSLYRKVLAFAQHSTGRPDLENLSDFPEYEPLCDAFLLIQSGAIECIYTDCLPDESREGIVVKMNME